MARLQAGVERGILAELLLRLAATLGLVEQDSPLAKMFFFDSPLRPSQRPCPRRGQGPGVLRAFPNLCGPLCAKAGRKNVIVQRHELPKRSWIALAGAAAGKLAIDASRLVKLGADNMQSAKFVDFVGQLDIGTTAGHVRGHGHPANLPSLCDDFRLFGVAASIQNLMLDSCASQ